MKNCDTPECTNIVIRKALCQKCFDKNRNQLPERKERKHFHLITPASREKSRQACSKYSRTVAGRFSLAKASAKRRGLEWTITLEEFKNFPRHCHYCNGGLSSTGSNLDRQNNKFGYHITNVVSCCRPCNELKSNRFNYSEMVAISALLIEMRLK